MVGRRNRVTWPPPVRPIRQAEEFGAYADRLAEEQKRRVLDAGRLRDRAEYRVRFTDLGSEVLERHGGCFSSALESARLAMAPRDGRRAAERLCKMILHHLALQGVEVPEDAARHVADQIVPCLDGLGKEAA